MALEIEKSARCFYISAMLASWEFPVLCERCHDAAFKRKFVGRNTHFNKARWVQSQSHAIFALLQGCQTHGVTMASRDILGLSAPSLKQAGEGPAHDASGPRATSLTPLLY